MPPPDWPVCGRLGELCAVAGPNIPLIVSVLLAVLVVFLVIAAGLVYRHYREEAAIASMHWKISEDEIMPTKLCGGWYNHIIISICTDTYRLDYQLFCPIRCKNLKFTVFCKFTEVKFNTKIMQLLCI